jgi:hypothetical protein
MVCIARASENCRTKADAYLTAIGTTVSEAPRGASFISGPTIPAAHTEPGITLKPIRISLRL